MCPDQEIRENSTRHFGTFPAASSHVFLKGRICGAVQLRPSPKARPAHWYPWPSSVAAQLVQQDGTMSAFERNTEPLLAAVKDAPACVQVQRENSRKSDQPRKSHPFVLSPLRHVVLVEMTKPL